MANLHMEALSDAEVLEVAEQALASLNARFAEDDRYTAEVFGATLEGMLTPAEEAVESITEACDGFDRFAELYREAVGDDA